MDFIGDFGFFVPCLMEETNNNYLSAYDGLRIVLCTYIHDSIQ